jgi:hypothetical protein
LRPLAPFPAFRAFFLSPALSVDLPEAGSDFVPLVSLAVALTALPPPSSARNDERSPGVYENEATRPATVPAVTKTARFTRVPFSMSDGQNWKDS